jgi:predicted transcriptional regulator
LQLAKKIDVSQQAVMKHLATLEEAGIVDTKDVPSPEGPPRRYYMLKKRFSIRIDVRPDYFDSRIQVMDHDISGGDVALVKAFKDFESEEDLQKRANGMSQLLREIDGRLGTLEEDYDRLVALKEEIQRELHRIIAQTSPDYRAREVLYCLVDSRASGVPEMSEILDLREKAIMDILDDMAKHQKFVNAMIENFAYRKI